MGFLTTFTVYNDGCDEIPANAEEFAKKIHNACLTDKVNTIGLSSSVNLIKAQKPRHASDETIYVHAGNSLFEMNKYSVDTQKLLASNPKFFKEMLDMMEYNLKLLNKLYADETKKPVPPPPAARKLRNSEHP